MDVVLQAEQMDSDGETRRTSAKRKRPAKSKPKSKRREISDPEDSDYESGDATSGSSDSDIEEILPNAEVSLVILDYSRD